MALISIELTDTLGTWRTKLNSLSANSGDLSSLITTNKSSIVAAINETETSINTLNSLVEGSAIGLLANLITTNKSSIVAAINETETSINTLGSMSAQSASNVNITGGSVSNVNMSSVNITGGSISGLTSIGATGGSLAGLSTFTVATNILPTTDNSRDLGSSSSEFKDIYSDGIIYADTFSVSNTAGEGLSTDLVPTTTASKNLGNNAYSYNNIYTRYIQFNNGNGAAGNYLEGYNQDGNINIFNAVVGSELATKITRKLDVYNYPAVTCNFSNSLLYVNRGIAQSFINTNAYAPSQGAITLYPYKYCISKTILTGAASLGIDLGHGRTFNLDSNVDTLSFTYLIDANNFAVTWFTGSGGAPIIWASGSAPILESTTQMIQFFTPDAGIHWIGSIPINLGY